MSQRTIRRIAAAVAILAVVCAAAVWLLSRPGGTTRQEREALLNQAFPETRWQIETEQELDGILLCGAVSTDGRAAVAEFEPDGRGGYRFSSAAARSCQEIIFSPVRIGRTWYDVVWFAGAPTAYAELHYTLDHQPLEPVRCDTSNMALICRAAPGSSYSMQAAYFDEAGNVIQST